MPPTRRTLGGEHTRSLPGNVLWEEMFCGRYHRVSYTMSMSNVSFVICCLWFYTVSVSVPCVAVPPRYLLIILSWRSAMAARRAALSPPPGLALRAPGDRRSLKARVSALLLVPLSTRNKKQKTKNIRRKGLPGRTDPTLRTRPLLVVYLDRNPETEGKGMKGDRGRGRGGGSSLDVKHDRGGFQTQQIRNTAYFWLLALFYGNTGTSQPRHVAREGV